MAVGKRSAIASTEAEAAALSLDELNRQIATLKYRAASQLSVSLRRSAFRRLVWLEAQRERLHGVKAPGRKFLSAGPVCASSRLHGRYQRLK